MSESDPELEAFSKFVVALEPWLGELVVVGGWAHRLYRLDSQSYVRFPKWRCGTDAPFARSGKDVHSPGGPRGKLGAGCASFFRRDNHSKPNRSRAFARRTESRRSANGTGTAADRHDVSLLSARLKLAYEKPAAYCIGWPNCL